MGLSPERVGFDPELVFLTFVVDEVALERVFLRVLQFSPISVIRRMLRTRLHLNTAAVKRTKPGTILTRQCCFRYW